MVSRKSKEQRMDPILTVEEFESIRRLDSCTVSNAIESFDVRMRNEGFAGDSSIRCMFPNFPPMLGYAVTGRLGTAAMPVASSFPPPFWLRFEDRTDWWECVESIPAPRVLVLEDTDRTPGVGAFMGEVHAAIFRSLGFVGYVTNGAVRDLDAVERAGFHFFAGHVSVSHAYAHLVGFGEPVRVGGMRVEPGALVHGDRHGVQTIPSKIASRLPAAAQGIQERDQKILALCQDPGFSIERLRALVKQTERMNQAAVSDPIAKDGERGKNG